MWKERAEGGTQETDDEDEKFKLFIQKCLFCFVGVCVCVSVCLCESEKTDRGVPAESAVAKNKQTNKQLS